MGLFHVLELIAAIASASALTRPFGSCTALRREIGIILAFADHQKRVDRLAFDRRILHRVGDLAVKLTRDLYGRFLRTDPDLADILARQSGCGRDGADDDRGVDILILDEPTAVLTPQEIEELIAIMHRLTDDGKTVIIITHKLAEIKKSSNYCTIIRRGQYIDTVDVSKVSQEDLATMMVGRQVTLHIQKEKAKPGDIVFSIDNLLVRDARGIAKVNGLSLNVRAGEILGIAGIDGNGQKELIEAINCLVPAERGTITVNGKSVGNTNPRSVIDSGISTIPEDRQKRGLVLDFSVNENAVLERYRQEPFSRKGILNKKEMEQFTKKLIEEFDVRPEDCGSKRAGGLSGGNQQKVIIGREISMNPDVLIAVQPTRGLDVGAIETVHRTLIRERDKGKAVLLISFELDEVMNVSDTIAVIYDGKIQDTFPQGTVDENTIGLLMAGGKNHG